MWLKWAFALMFLAALIHPGVGLPGIVFVIALAFLTD
jgi:hypothetical protein